MMDILGPVIGVIFYGVVAAIGFKILAAIISVLGRPKKTDWQRHVEREVGGGNLVYETERPEYGRGADGIDVNLPDSKMLSQMDVNFPRPEVPQNSTGAPPWAKNAMTWQPPETFTDWDVQIDDLTN